MKCVFLNLFQFRVLRIKGIELNMFKGMQVLGVLNTLEPI